jgi:hypothetical protein
MMVIMIMIMMIRIMTIIMNKKSKIIKRNSYL